MARESFDIKKTLPVTRESPKNTIRF